MVTGRPRSRGGKGSQNLLTAGQPHAAKTDLLQLPRGASEADIQDKIAAWLKSENIDYHLQYRTPTGPIDIHLKHLRCIIEVKRRKRLEKGPAAQGSGSGKTSGGESALDQITRYVASLREYGALDAGQEWRGVVTDGRRWWIWEWPKDGKSGGPRIVPGWNGRHLDMLVMDTLRDEVARKDAAARPWAPDDPTELFAPFIGSVKSVYHRNRSLANTVIQKRLWLEQLKGGGRYPEPKDEDDLFVRHTLLIIIARMVAGTEAGNGRRTRKGRAAKATAGPSTHSRLLEGFVGWMTNAPDTLDEIQSVIDRYDWRANQTDVMRALYMGFIPIEHRKSYGEYYTPDWLAEKICTDVIDDVYIARQVRRFSKGVAVEPILDPACGSGTFLHHAAMRLRNSKPVREAKMAVAALDDFVAGMVWGIDLHPVAVEMAAANMARLLPKTDAQRVHVYQGDSMLADAPTATLDGATGNSMTLRADGEMLTLPRRFVGGRPDAITAFVSSAVDGARLPTRLLNGLDKDERYVMKMAHKAMSVIIERNGNGVWGWYIRNQSAPMLLADAGSIGRIVSNAPWVRFSELKDKERQKKVEELGREVGVYAGAKMKTALDIAAIFVARCNGMYLAKNGRAGWVIPVSAIKGAGQWSRLRAKYAGMIAGFWDLGTLPFPEQGPCCTMLYARGGVPARKRSGGGGNAGAGKEAKVLRLVCHGKHPDEHDGWSGAVSKVARLEPAVEKAPGLKPILTDKTRKPSEWLTGVKGRRPIARQGAILTPSMLVRADEWPDDGDADTVRVNTTPSTHGVWRKLGTRHAAVPRSWLRRVILGRDILPFVVPNPTPHIIPIGDDGKWIDGRGRRGYWKDASNMYAANCGEGVHTPKTLEDQLDYHGKLLAQFPPAAAFVVYNTSGERLYAAAVDGPHIVESSSYRVPCRTRAEADFLAGILNADAMQRAFCESKMSLRHYHTYFWRSVPIPRYDHGNAMHADLSALGARARREARRLCERKKDGDEQTRKSMVKALQLSGTAREIDAAVKKVLPAYAVINHGLDKRRPRATGGRRAGGAGDKRQKQLTD